MTAARGGRRRALLPDRRGVGARLVVYTVLFSGFVTVVGTTLQLYLDYRHDVTRIHERMVEIESSHLPSVVDSLWETDGEQLRQQLQGLQQLGDIEMLRVVDPGGVVASVGEARASRTIRRRFPLSREHDGRPVALGVLEVVASVDAVIDRLLDRVLVILATQGVKTFLVSTFMLLIFQVLVNRRLAKLAAFARGLSPDRLDVPFDPAPGSGNRHDELDHVADALETMRGNLSRSYAELEHHRTGLQELVDERTAEVERKSEALAARTEEMASFVRATAHDLREPLRSISGFASLLRNRFPEGTDDDQTEYLGYITGGVERMEQLVDDLSELASVSRPNRRRERTSLNAVLDQVTADLSARVQETGGKIEVGELPEVDADPVTMRRLFQNLVGNALKFRHPDRAPRVRVFAEDAPEPEVRVVVEDNGIGFENAHAERIFGPFRRLHPHDEYEGSGLGLTIGRRVAEHHGGTLDATATPGRGARFRLRIPRAPSGQGVPGL